MPLSPIAIELIARASISSRSWTSSLQALGVAVAEVEAPQPGDALLVARGDPVEVVLHPRREVVVDEPREVALEQLDDREGEERRHERAALLRHVAAVEDRAHDRRVGRRAADAALLERADERRLGVARRRRRRVALRLELAGLELLALRRAAAAGAPRRRAASLVAALLVGGRKPRNVITVPAVGELGVRPSRRRSERTETVSPRASAICEATVRLQISS